jgi:hypothetical protein
MSCGGCSAAQHLPTKVLTGLVIRQVLAQFYNPNGKPNQPLLNIITFSHSYP